MRVLPPVFCGLTTIFKSSAALLHLHALALLVLGSAQQVNANSYARFLPMDGNYPDGLLRTAVDHCCAFPPEDQSDCTFSHLGHNFGPMKSWLTGWVTYMDFLFSGKSSCNPDISGWDVSAVTHMNGMFHGATLFNRDLSKWDVSSVTNMKFMFNGASSFDSDLSKWDVSSVWDMGEMFEGAEAFNRDISSWNIAKVTNMDSMFNGASSFNQDLCSWSSDFPYGSSSVFLASGCTFQDNPVEANKGPFCGDSCYAEFPAENAWPSGLLRTAVNQYCDSTPDAQSTFRFFHNGNDYGPIEGWKTGRVTDMYALFYYKACNPDISRWDTSSVTSMQSMFHGAGSFDGDLSKWDTGAVTTMAYMFYEASSFNGGDLSAWDVSSATYMAHMFYGASSFDSDLSTWDMSSATNMAHMFEGATSFNRDISSWNIAKVTNMDSMFNGASSFNQNLCSWNSNFPYGSASDIFVGSGCAFAGDPVQANKGPFCTSVSCKNFPADGALLRTAVDQYCALSPEAQSTFTFSHLGEDYGSIEDWRTGLVTNMEALFYGKSTCNPDISGWDTSSVTNMAWMFGNSGFNRDISNWNIAKVTNMDSMFYGASSFNQDLCSWSSDFPYGSLSVFLYSGCTYPTNPVQANKGPFCAHTCKNFPADGALLKTAVDEYCDLSSEEQSTFAFIDGTDDYGRIEDWRTGLVTNMEALFHGKSTCNPDISGWDTSSVTIMAWMFGNSGFNRDISSWNIAKVTNMDSMFYSASSFNQNLCSWSSKFPYGSLSVFLYSGCTYPTNPVQANKGPFCGDSCYAEFPADGALLGTAVAHCCALSSEAEAQSDCTFSDSSGNYYGPMKSWRTGLVTNMEALFYGKSTCNPDISGWDTSSVTIMAHMFRDSGFNRDISSWNIAKMTNMGSMFHSASSFNQNLCSWKSDFPYGAGSSNVFTASGCTFQGDPVQANKGPFCGDDCFVEFPADGALLKTAVDQCCALSSGEAQSDCTFFDSSGNYYGPMKSWRTGLVTTMYALFYSKSTCNPDISRWDTSSVTNMHSMFHGASWFNSDVSNWDTGAVTDMGALFYWATSFNRDLSKWDVSSATNMAHMFDGAKSFNSDLSKWDVSSVWNMAHMFYAATSFNRDISSWNIAKVTNMDSMFIGASSFNQNLCSWSSDFPYSSASGIFLYSGCTFQGNPVEGNKGPFCGDGCYADFPTDGALLGTAVAQCCALSSEEAQSDCTFSDSSGNYGPMKSWRTGLVTNMEALFYGKSTCNPDISGWDTSSVTIMAHMFRDSGFNRDISSWNIANVANMDQMFNGASSFNQNLCLWNSDFPYGSLWVFAGSGCTFTGDPVEANKGPFCTSVSCKNFPADGALLKTAVAECCALSSEEAQSDCTFSDSSGSYGPMKSWHTGLVTTMYALFYFEDSCNPDISGWDTSSVTNMHSMFHGATSFSGDVSNWNTGAVTDMGAVFYGATSFNRDLSTWDVSSATYMAHMFYGASSFNSDLSTWDVSSATNMAHMFEGASSFDSDLSNWDVSSVTNMEEMFEGAAAFNSDISSWNIAKVTNMGSMFHSASSFNQNLCSWKSDFPYGAGSSNVFTASGCTFQGDPVQANKGPFCGDDCIVEFPADGALLGTAVAQCCALSSGEAQSDCTFSDSSGNYYGPMKSWRTGLVTNMEALFYGKSTCNPDISGWDTSSVTIMAHMFRDSGFNRDISSWNIANVANMDQMFNGASSFNQNLCLWNSDFPYGSLWVFAGSGCTFTGDPVEANKGPFCTSVSCKPSDIPSMRPSDIPSDEPSSGPSSMPSVSPQPSNSYAQFPPDGALLKAAVTKCCALSPGEAQSDCTFTDSSGNNYGPMKSWRTGLVTNMEALFHSKSSCNPDISGWDVSAVTNMNAMFYGATLFNRDLSKWDISSVTIMAWMFGNSGFNRDISNWNIAKVTNMDSMFNGASSFNQDLCLWGSDFPYGSASVFLASGCTFQDNPVEANKGPFCGDGCNYAEFPADGDLLKAAVTKCCALPPEEQSDCPFSDSSDNNYGPMKSWRTGLVTNMDSLFHSKSSCNPDISRWDVSAVTNMNAMFFGASSFDRDLSSWDISSVTIMAWMFGNSGFNRDISNWNIAKVTNMDSMFNGASSFNQDLCLWGSEFPYGSASVFLASGCTFQDNPVEANKGPFCGNDCNYAEFPADGGDYPDGLLQTAVGQYCASSSQSTFTFSHGGKNYGPIELWRTGLVTTMQALFDNKDACDPDISRWDVSSVKNMESMFNGASSFKGDLSKWDVSSVTNMLGMFYNAAQFNGGDLSKWKTGAVISMESMFEGASSFTGDISNWNTGAVTNMARMFKGASSFDGILSNWNTAAVTTMERMFDAATSFTGDISNWNTAAVTNMAWMFFNAAKFSGGDLSSWDTGAVIYMNSMFSGASLFNGNLSGWDTKAVTNMGWMFYNAAKFNGGDLSNWDTAAVIYMNSMFSGASLFNGDVSKWNTAKVTNMGWMFYNAAKFNGGDLSNWDTGAVIYMNSMFAGASLFNGDVSKWNTAEVTNMSYMFYKAAQFNGNLSNWNTAAVTTMESMFGFAAKFDGNLSDWNTAKVTNMGWMFYNAAKFNGGDLSNWDTGAVIYMNSMFAGASLFNGDVSNWNTGAVTNMAWMFWEASSFNDNISNWKTANVENMREMFEGAISFNGDVSKWNIAKVTNMDSMFNGASSFNQNLCSWNSDFPYSNSANIFTNSGCTFTSDPVEANKGPFCGDGCYAEFPADGALLKTAVDQCCALSSEEAQSDCNFSDDSGNYGPMKSWRTGLVTSMHELFRDKDKCNPDISGWDVSVVTEMHVMFYGASWFNRDLSTWDVSSATNMAHMFDGASSFDSDLSKWDVSSVWNMGEMFEGAEAFNSDISSWNIAKVTIMGNMFKAANSFNQNLCSWSSAFPYGSSADIFTDSGCTFTSNPVEANLGPFCANDCAPSSQSHPSSSSVPSSHPSSSSSSPSLSLEPSIAPTAELGGKVVATFEAMIGFTGLDISSLSDSSLLSFSALLEDEIGRVVPVPQSSGSSSEVKVRSIKDEGGFDFSVMFDISMTQQCEPEAACPEVHENLLELANQAKSDILELEESGTLTHDIQSSLVTNPIVGINVNERERRLPQSRNLNGISTTGATASAPQAITTLRSDEPSSQPSSQPSDMPSSSLQPSDEPSLEPSSQPSDEPSLVPSISTQPSSQPLSMPSDVPSLEPSSQPSIEPSSMPSDEPSSQPSGEPSSEPSSTPSCSPSSAPTESPSTASGVNLFYPEWVSGREGCRNDGDEPDYMAVNPTEWLSSTMQACCKKFFGGYYYDSCIGRYPPDRDECTVKLYYPDWNGANNGCTDDGREPYYMLSNAQYFLSNTREECCEKFYGWNYFECTGTKPQSSGGYYPDWTGASSSPNTCLNDGKEPLYMWNSPTWYLSPTLKECCERHFHWALNDCTGTQDVGSGKWYVKYDAETCVQDCTGASNSNCGGIAKSWDELFGSKKACCDEKLWYVDNCISN